MDTPGKRAWSIQIFWQARDDDDKPFRATSVYWIDEAETVGEAYDIAAKQLGENYKLGAILPGKKLRFP